MDVHLMSCVSLLPGIGGIFLLVAFICAVQLTICVVSEYRRLKAPTFLRACKVTTQKMLYFVAFLASLIRGAYFVSPVRPSNYQTF